MNPHQYSTSLAFWWMLYQWSCPVLIGCRHVLPNYLVVCVLTWLLRIIVDYLIMCYPIIWLCVFLPDCCVLLSITLYIYIMLQNCLVVCCNQMNNWLCIPLPNCFVMHYYHSGVCAVSVLFGCVCVGLPNCLVMCVVTHLTICLCVLLQNWLVVCAFIVNKLKLDCWQNSV